MKTVIWDFDGTIGYREGKWSGTVLEILDEYLPGHGVERDEIHNIIAHRFPWDEWQTPRVPDVTSAEWWDRLDPLFIETFSEVADLDNDDSVKFAKKVRDFYPRLAPWKLFDDTIPCMRNLKESGWTQIILSNHVPELDRILQYLELSEFIDKTFNSAVTGIEKPNQLAFEQVLEHTGGEGLHVMVGDNPVADGKGAASVGIPAVLVRNAKGHGNCCESLEELPGILDSLL